MYLLRELLRLLLLLRRRLLDPVSQAHGLALRFWLCNTCQKSLQNAVCIYTYFPPSLCEASVVMFLHLCASKLFLDVRPTEYYSAIVHRHRVWAQLALGGSCPSTLTCNSHFSAIRQKQPDGHTGSRNAYPENSLRAELIPTATAKSPKVQPLHPRLSVTILIGHRRA